MAEYFFESVGGGGANVAIGATNHGLNTAVFSKIGENSFKQIILQKLLKKMVSTEFLIHDPSFTNISTILLSSKGEKSVIHHATLHEDLDVNEVIREKLLSSKLFYMGNLPDISLSRKEALLSFLKKNNKKVYLNIGTSDCQKRLHKLTPLLKLADILIINTYEYAQLLGLKKEKIDFTKDCAKQIMFSDKLLILTDGPGGSYGYFEGKVHHKPAYKATVIDTTGAGDAYVAGFISSQMKDESIEKSMEMGSLYAVKIIEKVGAN